MKEWKGISRRDFLKGAAAGAVGVAAVGVLGGCSPSESNSDEAKSYNVSETKSADIVVVGSGASGICATVQAAELGAQVILLESNSVLGGNGILTEGMFAIGSSLQKHLVLVLILLSGKLLLLSRNFSIIESMPYSGRTWWKTLLITWNG